MYTKSQFMAREPERKIWMANKLEDITSDSLKEWITSEGFMWVPMPNTPPELLQQVKDLCFVLNGVN